MGICTLRDDGEPCFCPDCCPELQEAAIEAAERVQEALDFEKQWGFSTYIQRADLKTLLEFVKVTKTKGRVD